MTEKKVRGLPQNVLEDIAKLYGLSVASFGIVEGGYRNSSHSFMTTNGRNLNFILYKREPGITDLIQRTNALGTYLVAQGLPVRAPVDDRILRVGQRFGSLYGYIDGQTIPWESYSMKHIKLLGYALARFHAVSEGFCGNLPNVEDEYVAIYARMTAYFGDAHIRRALSEKLGLRVVLPDIGPLLSNARQLTPRIALHMDMVRSNLLFKSTSNCPATDSVASGILQVGDVMLSGILDLEKAAYGHGMFDVARTLAFLLVDCDKPEAKVRKYFLESGYRKRGVRNLKTFVVEGEDLLEQLITMFLTYDFYKFLRQNPYESLSKNHHFIRTERILRERKVLQ